jgi:XRE family aerobic/anaerobic benzoate catabolism transcriptional regulator
MGLLEQIGIRVATLRKVRGLTLKRLADASELSVRFLGDLEKGRGNIAVARLERVADALSVPLVTLLVPGTGDLSSIERVGQIVSQLGGRSEAALRRIQTFVQSAEPADKALGLVALTGIRGAGKSTIGSRLAKALRVPFVELDRLIEDRAGLSLTDIFSMHGDDYYRVVEYEVLSQLIDEKSAAVVATGGSIVTHPETWGLLQRSATTVWLKGNALDHWHRVLDQGDDRPMRRNPAAFSQLEALIQAREPLYRQADRIVETHDVQPEEVLERVLTQIGVG